MQTTVRSASSGFAWVKPRLAVQRTSPLKTRLVLLSSGEKGTVIDLVVRLLASWGFFHR